MSQESAQWLLDEELQIFGLHVAGSARQGKVLQGADPQGISKQMWWVSMSYPMLN